MIYCYIGERFKLSMSEDSQTGANLTVMSEESDMIIRAIWVDGTAVGKQALGEAEWTARGDLFKGSRCRVICLGNESEIEAVTER